jgi:alkanesulfonate monooxygenase SsuD/methylene tetrahydromethanopterin reductase-like flavin-dependent oxidoreductase (luciferase family)
MVEFGISMSGLDGVAEHARRVEALGFDYVAVGDHIVFHVPAPNSFVALSIAAAVTERVKLMSSVVAAPLYPPVLLAKFGAALSVVSGGRYELGIGVGGEHPAEFAACGVPVSERGRRANEALEIIKRLWTGESVTFAGQFSTLSEISIKPAPSLAPPIWVSGRKDAAMVRAARFGDGWLPYMYTPQMLADSITRIDGLLVDGGRAAGSVRPGLLLFACCHPDAAVATRYAAKRLSWQYNQDFTELAPRYLIAGNSRDCRTRLQEFIDAGAQTVLLASACPDDYVHRNELLLAEVVEQFGQPANPANYTTSNV